jgi:hypothetical protein
MIFDSLVPPEHGSSSSRAWLFVAFGNSSSAFSLLFVQGDGEIWCYGSVKYRSLFVSLTGSWRRLLQDASCLICLRKKNVEEGRGRNVTTLSTIVGDSSGHRS